MSLTNRSTYMNNCFYVSTICIYVSTIVIEINKKKPKSIYNYKAITYLHPSFLYIHIFFMNAFSNFPYYKYNNTNNKSLCSAAHKKAHVALQGIFHLSFLTFPFFILLYFWFCFCNIQCFYKQPTLNLSSIYIYKYIYIIHVFVYTKNVFFWLLFSRPLQQFATTTTTTTSTLYRYNIIET